MGNVSAKRNIKDILFWDTISYSICELILAHYIKFKICLILIFLYWIKSPYYKCQNYFGNSNNQQNIFGYPTTVHLIYFLQPLKPPLVLPLRGLIPARLFLSQPLCSTSNMRDTVKQKIDEPNLLLF